MALTGAEEKRFESFQHAKVVPRIIMRLQITPPISAAYLRLPF